MQVLVMSDIHGNLAALEAVMDLAGSCPDIAGCILLGDLIDYGMHSSDFRDREDSLSDFVQYMGKP